MEVMELSLPATNRLATEYMKGTFPIHEAFHHFTFEERLAYVHERTYAREALVDHLLTYHEQFGASDETMANIKKLRHPKSVVVIGGQQAGLLTGPLYTIYKIISIITLAKQQERELGVPVVPVFWMASEDHDVAEINHVHVCDEGKVKKYVYPPLAREKRMAARIELNEDDCKQWIDEVLKTYGETDVTNELRAYIYECIAKSKTIADFFAAIVLSLFAKEGLVVVDAAHPHLRAIESKWFMTIAHNHHMMTNALNEQQRHLEKLGYSRTIDVSPMCAHLFYDDGQRRLLYYDDRQRCFYTKDGVYRFTLDELKQRMEREPQSFSNNVVTRPLMQEWLFPTLAFIAGPGEIAYWAELKQVFEHVGLRMPPIVPRLSLTLVERHIATDLADVHMTVEQALANGTDDALEEWLRNNQPIAFDEAFDEAKKEMARIHEQLRHIGMQVDPHLERVMLKNAERIETEIDYLQQLIARRMLQKHDVHVRKYERIALALRPNGMPQERVWNMFYYMNRYGLDVVSRLLHVDYRWNGLHKIVYM
ncbi:bacillithiol biosynthesis cysteine-adding enzyme BshC [Anoxybacillus sp. ST4]|uniref:bacillithiol biosynthesis cysteine-adding enzyme BshC n=1 Tax=Anoxybacillus sp. ST4 TaxID=2864181 RepID=UPI001C642233|nr:bacillithiol biosynthesis cysteine-adding enzyme BshC [Anoxybacillus sp. ST4]MBW7650179.1 bacillithiol biosynthesis cysteine-adding enzyme BshC [Anoxybacillus sp. ST4]